MSYLEIDEGIVFNCEEIITPNQTAVEKKFKCYERQILISAAKTNIAIGEELIINIKWQRFDLDTEAYLDDVDHIEDFKLNAASTEDIVPAANGAFVFSSKQAGEFTIRTVNPDAFNNEMKVVVS